MDRFATASIAVKMADAASVQICALDPQAVQSAGLGTSPPALPHGALLRLRMRALEGRNAQVRPEVRALIKQTAIEHEAGLRYLADL